MTTISLPIARESCGRASAGPDEPDRIAAIGKTMLLYDALRSTPDALRLRDLSRSTGMAKSTTHRLLGALVGSGMVTRLGVGYVAVPRPGDGVRATDRHRDLLRRLAPFACDALIRTRCTASLAVLDGPDVVFAHRVYSHDNVSTPSDTTGRERAHLTAAGRLLLSHDLSRACDAARDWGLDPEETGRLGSDLMSIRRRGFAVRQENGISCVAMTLRAVPGEPPIAITVKGRETAGSAERILIQLRTVVNAARADDRRSAR